MGLNKPVDFTTAKLLKEKGFDEPCINYYLIPEIERTGEIILHYCSRGKEILKNNDWTWVYNNFPSFRKYLKAEHCYKYSLNNSKILVTAPTIAEVIMWLYEKHGFWISSIPSIQGEGFDCNYYVGKDKFGINKHPSFVIDSPTEAYEAGIEYTLNNLI